MTTLFWNFVDILILFCHFASKLFGTETLTIKLIIHLIKIKRLAKS